MSKSALTHGLVLLMTLGAASLHAAGLDDPMRPPGALLTEPSVGMGKGTAASGYRLTSTLVAAERRLAVINGRRYAEGDRLNTALVEQIRLTEVVLRHPWGRQTLRLIPRTIKRPSKP